MTIYFSGLLLKICECGKLVPGKENPMVSLFDHFRRGFLHLLLTCPKDPKHKVNLLAAMTHDKNGRSKGQKVKGSAAELRNDSELPC